eukprot:XP_025980711.1 uncharacterized protein LOC112998753 [Glycine max]
MDYTNSSSTQNSQSQTQTPTQPSQWPSTTAQTHPQTYYNHYPSPFPYYSYPPQYMTPPTIIPHLQFSLTPPPPQDQNPKLRLSLQPAQTSKWYPNSSASHHVTNVSHNIQQVTPFEGPDQITIGNGQGLNIYPSSVSSFHSPFNSKVPLTLKNLLSIPSITKNLPSVSQLCKDN